MKQLYLVCTRSAVTASALTYIINTSPDFYNMAHNNLWLKEHSEWFGDAHIIDDWWNVHDDDIAKAYDPDFRNNIELSEEKTLQCIMHGKSFQVIATYACSLMHVIQKTLWHML